MPAMGGQLEASAKARLYVHRYREQILARVRAHVQLLRATGGSHGRLPQCTLIEEAIRRTR